MKLALKLSVSLMVLTMASLKAPAQCARGPAVCTCPTNGLTFIIVADGAGAYSTLANNFKDVVYELPVAPSERPIVKPIEWSSGDNLLDYRSRKLHFEGGTRMAWEALRIRKISPDSPIVLVGYSAGACVAMSAAEQLPPNSVDRIILLGPTVASNYDVRLALRASKCGIDAFYVPGDQWLEQMEDRYGAPYGPPGSTVAGTHGFTMVQRRACLKDPILWNFREHPIPDLQGEHFGTAKTGFLKCNVMPLVPRGFLLPLPCATSAPAGKCPAEKAK